MKPKCALSVRQPWAWLICAGHKDIENRNWAIRRTSVVIMPERVYIHAGQKPDGRNYNETKHIQASIRQLLGRQGKEEEAEAVFGLVYFPEWRPWYGAIIGEVDITGCVTRSDSPWFCGPYGFTLANPVLYEKPIPYTGKLGFFEVTLPEVS